MLSKTYARDRVRLLDATKANCLVAAGQPPPMGNDTTYLCTADELAGRPRQGPVAGGLRGGDHRGEPAAAVQRAPSPTDAVGDGQPPVRRVVGRREAEELRYIHGHGDYVRGPGVPSRDRIGSCR